MTLEPFGYRMDGTPNIFYILCCCMSMNMSNPDSIVVFLDTLKLKDEYLQRFKDTGFDDLNLLKSLSEDERQDMFSLVGLSNKPGHLLKFKKALVAACENDKRPATSSCEESKPKKVQNSKCVYLLLLYTELCACVVYINMNI